MSRREWKPGDVLTDAEGSAFFVVEVTANSRAAWGEGLHAVDADGNGWRLETIGEVRPLVVIDPEDREQVERLAELIIGHPKFMGFGAVANALREFANPKPPKCSAVVSIRGEHFACDDPSGHGTAHGNSAAGAIWAGESA